MSEIIPKGQDKLTTDTDLTTLGEMANQAAGLSAFEKYRIGRAKNTIKRHRIDVQKFSDFLRSIGAEIEGDMFRDPRTWRGVTWGLIEKYQEYLLNEGFAVSTVNARISTIKVYAGLAAKSGVIDAGQIALIKEVKGFGLAQAENIDERREELGIDTRIGHKKKDPVLITPNKADQLKDQPDTPQGRRDRLLVCLLLDHGLRCSEVEGLKVEDFDLDAGKFTFTRPKVKATKYKQGKHYFSNDTWEAARAYFENDQHNTSGQLLKGSRKNGELYNGMSKNAISGRVRTLGDQIGLKRLSAHDCRHFCCTFLSGYMDTYQLMRFFGWSSPAMAVRYQESQEFQKHPLREGVARLANGE